MQCKCNASTQNQLTQNISNRTNLCMPDIGRTCANIQSPSDTSISFVISSSRSRSADLPSAARHRSVGAPSDGACGNYALRAGNTFEVLTVHEQLIEASFGVEPLNFEPHGAFDGDLADLVVAVVSRVACTANAVPRLHAGARAKLPGTLHRCCRCRDWLFARVADSPATTRH